MARAPIDPSALEWARETSRVTLAELARALGVKPSRVAEFESGDAQPTFRQLTLMAGKLDRPLGFFFAPPPAVSDVPYTADFRGRADLDLPADLAKEMRRAEQHRDTMLDLGARPERSVDIRPITWDTIAERAADLREQFGLTETFVPPESSKNQVFSFWRGLLEDNGILVLQTTKIPLQTFRGLSVYHHELPVVIVNGSDSPAGRTFTLFHEVAHLVNRTSGLCALRETVNEEALANNFAAAFLMPESAVRMHIVAADDPATVVDHLARHFKVSPLAAAVRLRRLGVISAGELDSISAASEERWEQARLGRSRAQGSSRLGDSAIAILGRHTSALSLVPLRIVGST